MWEDTLRQLEAAAQELSDILSQEVSVADTFRRAIEENVREIERLLEDN